MPESVSENPFVNMYQAVRRAILTLRENPEDPQSPSFFRTIMIDTGQFSRIVRSENLEMEIAFPAIFIRFVNVRYLVQQQRIGEGLHPQYAQPYRPGTGMRPVHRFPTVERRHSGCQKP